MNGFLKETQKEFEIQRKETSETWWGPNKIKYMTSEKSTLAKECRAGRYSVHKKYNLIRNSKQTNKSINRLDKNEVSRFSTF